MGTINKVLLIGRMGKDPEDRTTAGGTRVSQFTLATDAYHGSNSDKTTEWHRIVAFGKNAELCNQYLKKGRLVCVEGAMQTRSWEKAPGDKHSITEVVAAHITFLDSPGAHAGMADAHAEASDMPF